MASKLIIEKYSPDIEKFMKNNSNKNKLFRYIYSYMKKNSEALSYNVPIYKIPFNKAGMDYKIVMDVTGINPREMKKDINSISEIKKYADVLKDPLYFVLTMIIFEYNKQVRLTKKEEEEFNTVLMYLTLSMYWSIQYRQFNFEPNDNVAQYTYNRLSNKYYFKKYKTVEKALLVTAENNNTNLVKENKTDDDIIKYVMSLRTRISNMMVKFANEFYKDNEAGNYINKTISSSDEDNFIPESDSASSLINSLTQKVLNSFIKHRVKGNLLRISCNMTKTSPATLNKTLDDIRNNEIDKTRQIISNIMAVYISDKRNSIDTIGTSRFISESIKIYSLGNITDKKVIEIKDNLDIFLKKYNNKYSQTEREATRNNYRKTLFIYFVLLISDAL